MVALAAPVSSIPRLDVRTLHERMGKVWNQPVPVKSFTNKRLTINYRVPIDRLRQLVPDGIQVEEFGRSGVGMLSQCVCDFTVTRFGPVPIPKTHTNEMLTRISVQIPKGGENYRAYYTLRSDTSSDLLAVLGGHFSHFRKARSDFQMRDDGEVYELTCRATDPICGGYFCGEMESLSKDKPATSMFADVTEATEFLFNLDGSAGYAYASDQLSFQHIQYPPWDIQFCHAADYQFNLIDYLNDAYDLQMEFDCILFMEKIPQVWGTSWLYRK